MRRASLLVLGLVGLLTLGCSFNAAPSADDAQVKAQLDEATAALADAQAQLADAQAQLEACKCTTAAPAPAKTSTAKAAPAPAPATTAAPAPAADAGSNEPGEIEVKATDVIQVLIDGKAVPYNILKSAYIKKDLAPGDHLIETQTPGIRQVGWSEHVDVPGGKRVRYQYKIGQKGLTRLDTVDVE